MKKPNDTIAWWIAARFHGLHEWAFLMCDRFETGPIWKIHGGRPRLRYDLYKKGVIKDGKA